MRVDPKENNMFRSLCFQVATLILGSERLLLANAFP